jgi:threonine dehydrogenase-like Zn-dependent dehydrogenase
MKAVLVEAPGSISYRALDPPVLRQSELLVRSHAAGLCRTDIEIRDGLVPQYWIRYPIVPGHEWSGTVVEMGEGVEGFALGDRVVSEGMVPCNRCKRCRMGETNICENYDQIGFTRHGGYGELVAVPQHTAHRLSDQVSLDAAVLVEPASCVYRALKRISPQPGDTIGIVGVGALGSLALLLARLFSPGILVALGVREEELEFAARLGASHTVNVARETPSAVHGIVPGGLDVVVETAGSPAAVRTALDGTRIGGKVALLGLAGSSSMLTVPSDEFVVKDLEVVGSLSYTTEMWTSVLNLLETERLDFEPIVTHRFRIEDFMEAMDFMERREGVVAKVLLCHPE